MRPSVEVVAVAENVSKAVEAIEKDRPELIFLDIQLGNETSFELLDQISLKDLHIIFVTAYNQHAVKAFQFSAVDYILKPINPVRLQDAIQKISYTETDTKGSHDA